MSKEVAEFLTKARNILENKGWTQGYFARDSTNSEVGADSPQATCFCSAGAIWKVTGLPSYRGPRFSLERKCLNQLSEVMDLNIPKANDDEDTKLIHVLIAFDFAILMAQENEVFV